jgi:hypothetical protein
MDTSQTNQLFTIGYISRATQKMSLEQLLAIVDHAEIANEAAQITGSLFYEEGIFGQVLEGTSKDLYELMDKISKDPRHDHLISTHLQSLSERRFSNWSMHLNNSSFVYAAIPELQEFKKNLPNTPEWAVLNSNEINKLSETESFEKRQSIFRYLYCINRS